MGGYLGTERDHLPRNLLAYLLYEGTSLHGVAQVERGVITAYQLAQVAIDRNESEFCFHFSLFKS